MVMGCKTPSDSDGAKQWRLDPADAWGEGGLNPWGLGASNRPASHAQIFFHSAKLLIIFFISKKSNGGALSTAQQCKPSQVLRRGVLGGRSWIGWNSRIYFRSQSGRTRAAVKSSVGPRSRTAWLRPGTPGGLNLKGPFGRGPHGSLAPKISKLNTESPLPAVPGPPGGSISGAFRPGTAQQAGAHFREIPKTFFVRAQATAGLGARSKNVA
jgi:hypothetical protein